MPTAVSKGGQKAPAALDRIPTPDGLNVEEVMAAAAKVQQEKALEAARRRRHMNDCASFRGQECNCPCNLTHLPPPLEARKVGAVEWVRVDEEHFVKVRRPDPTQQRGPMIEMDVLVLPRWICTSCGLAQRVVAPGQHVCDESYLLWKAKPLPTSALVLPEQRTSGAYRLTIWRDAEYRYHLVELVLSEGRVVAERERLVESDYSIIEAAMSDALIEEFSS